MDEKETTVVPVVFISPILPDYVDEAVDTRPRSEQEHHAIIEALAGTCSFTVEDWTKVAELYEQHGRCSVVCCHFTKGELVELVGALMETDIQVYEWKFGMLYHIQGVTVLRDLQPLLKATA